MSKKEDQIFHYAYDDVKQILEAGEYPFLVGPPGTGKNFIAEQIAGDLGLEYSYTGAVSHESKLVGFKSPNGAFQRTPFIEKYENGGVFLMDEVDGSDSGALLAVNAAIANGKLDTPVPDLLIEMHPDFKLIAAGNTSGSGATAGFSARTKLDGATLSRYTVIPFGYDTKLEAAITKKYDLGKDGNKLLGMIHQARDISVELDLGLNLEASTRCLIKGLNFLKVGMPLDKAFALSTFDKLRTPEEKERVIHYMEGSVNNEMADKIMNAGEDMRTRIRGVFENLHKLEEYQRSLRQLNEEAEQTLSKSFGIKKTLNQSISDITELNEAINESSKVMRSLSSDVLGGVSDRLARTFSKLQERYSEPVNNDYPSQD
ncbi:MAG: AAA family ATPase [Alphaproteobacteria bacterium]